MDIKKSLSDLGCRCRTAALVAGTGGLSWLFAMTWITRTQRRVDSVHIRGVYPALVFGCRPGPAFDARIHAAHCLLRAGRADKIIISGQREADYAHLKLLKMGVAKHLIELEPRARSTVENLTLSASLLGDKPFWAVSDRWHLPRIATIARELKMQAIPYPVERRQSKSNYTKVLLREGLSVTHRWANRRGLL